LLYDEKERLGKAFSTFFLHKVELEGIAPDALSEFANKMRFELLCLSVEDAASFYHLPRTTHQDPFVRMLIWQAIREKSRKTTFIYNPHRY